jgi:hypothetical protein
VTRTRVTALSQASRRHASGSRAPRSVWPPGGAALEAVQIHQDGQLGPDPTGPGEPAPLQAPPGQLTQGVGVALAAASGVVAGGRAGQGLQGGQEGLAGLGLQQPVDGDQAVPG